MTMKRKWPETVSSESQTPLGTIYIDPIDEAAAMAPARHLPKHSAPVNSRGRG
jgi:hypothetical protein